MEESRVLAPIAERGQFDNGLVRLDDSLGMSCKDIRIHQLNYSAARVST